MQHTNFQSQSSLCQLHGQSHEFYSTAIVQLTSTSQSIHASRKCSVAVTQASVHRCTSMKCSACACTQASVHRCTSMKCSACACTQASVVECTQMSMKCSACTQSKSHKKIIIILYTMKIKKIACSAFVPCAMPHAFPSGFETQALL